MEELNEYDHLVSCTKMLKSIPTGSDAWWTRVRFLKDRARSSWMLGRITLEQFTKFDDYFNKIMKQVKELSLKKATKENQT